MLPKEFNPPNSLDEFYAGFNNAETPEQKLLLVIRTAVIDEEKNEGKFLREALNTLDLHLAANLNKVISFSNKIMELRGKYLEKFEEYIHISSWNKIQKIISKYGQKTLDA